MRIRYRSSSLSIPYHQRIRTTTNTRARIESAPCTRLGSSRLRESSRRYGDCREDDSIREKPGCNRDASTDQFAVNRMKIQHRNDELEILNTQGVRDLHVDSNLAYFPNVSRLQMPTHRRLRMAKAMKKIFTRATFSSACCVLDMRLRKATL